VARALADGIDADLVVVGPDDLIGGIPAKLRIGVGSWGEGRGERFAPSAGESLSLLPSPDDAAAGRLSAVAIESAARLALEGKVDAIVTAPVHKAALHAAGYAYPGVTEFLAHLAGDVEVAMMLVAGVLRVVLVTTHLPLREVPDAVTEDRVVRVGEIARDALRTRWGVAAPRLAVCALNPHAGEGGLFGDEDEQILRPAAQRLGAAGPVPADTVFVRALRGEFDAVLTPYHDVGMTAVKVAGFGSGVNVTLGLPFVRTAPDHGTAFDIAGTGKAESGSMRAALELAARLSVTSLKRTG